MGYQIGHNIIKMLNIMSHFLIYKYQTDDVQYFTVDIQNLLVTEYINLLLV